MRNFLALLLSILIMNVSAQVRKQYSYRYTHNCSPIVKSELNNKYSYFMVKSPYRNMYDYTITQKYLTPTGYKDSKEKSVYIIEYSTSEVTPVWNNDGTVKMSVMLMYYKYKANVRIYDQNGNVVSQRELGVCDENNTIFIDEPVMAMNVYHGDQYLADDYIKKNLPVIYKSSLSDADAFIEYSFNGKHDVDTLYVFSGKATKQKYDYKELDNTAVLFKNTMALHNTKKEDTAKTRVNVKKCISVWEKELKNANFKDNGARINHEVAMGLYYNLAVAYFVLEDYAKAYEYIHKTYKKEVDHQQQLRPFTDFEIQAMAFEKTILLCWNK